MPDTFKEFDTTFEVALSMEYGGVLASGHERKQIGDILTVRPVRGVVGDAERKRFLWLHVRSSNDSEFVHALQQPMFTGTIETEDRVQYEKRRYYIPLAKLKEAMPSFDVSRALDVTDPYQPFLGTDEDLPWRTLYQPVALGIEGLVYDKQLGRLVQ